MTDEIRELEEKAKRAVEELSAKLDKPFMDLTVCIRDGEATITEWHVVSEDRTGGQPRSLPNKRLRAI